MQTPICKDCGHTMFEIGGIGKDTQLGEMRTAEGLEFPQWFQTGVGEIKLYQCTECKTIILK